MILSRPFSGAVRGVGRNALDLPVAAFAAVAVAFLAFAMPGELMESLVGATGLPAILPAAEAPLGYKARIGVGLFGAAAVFGLVFLLLRFLDRTGYDGEDETAAPEPEADALRARRRDAHPDAPAPRPISAARDFGEPAPPIPQPAPRQIEPAAAEPVQPAPAPPPPIEPCASLPELMARLEEGLRRRRIGRGAAPAPAPQVFPEAGDDRLQSAIDSLQRLAARHH